jgi:putative membrane protein
MMDGYGYGFGAMAWGWWLFAALIIAGIVVLVVLLVRMVGGRPNSDAGQATTAQRGEARRILDERYARGELKTEEYQERVRALGETR